MLRTETGSTNFPVPQVRRPFKNFSVLCGFRTIIGNTPLPPGLGAFPLNLVDDYVESLPDVWREHGGVFFRCTSRKRCGSISKTAYPMAVKVAAGKIDALTGEPWNNELTQQPQDYLVVPDQPWLDGFCVAKGLIRQFVAMPLGEGYTAEEQLTGEAQHGDASRIAVYPMKV